MKNAFLLLAAFVFALVSLALPACNPKPGTGPGITVGKVVSCGTQTVAQHAPEALPAVNQCLAGQGDVTACLLGLVQPAVGITIDVIGCLVRHEGSAASAASQANPGDAVDTRRAARAHEFLEKQGLIFQD